MTSRKTRVFIFLFFTFSIFYIFSSVSYAQTRRFGNSSLRTFDGLYIVHTQGDAYSMAYEVSRLMAKEMSEGMIPYMGTVVSDMLSSSGTVSLPVGIINFLTDIVFHRPLMRNLQPRERRLIKGIAEGMRDGGFPIELGVVEKGYVAPEAVHLLITQAVEWGLVPGTIGTPQLGCSSVVVLPEHTGSEKTLFIRGMDYSGINRYEKAPTLSFTEPTEGFRYVTISSAGLTGTALTAVNEKGLTLGLHVTMTADVNKNGRNILGITEEIIRTSASIEDAYAIVTRGPHISGWQIHLSDLTPDGLRRAGVIEISGAHTVLHIRQTSSVVVNHYYDGALRKRELNMGMSVVNHNQYRQERLEGLIEKHAQSLDVHEAVEILRDNYDTASESWVSYSPNIVSAVDQVSAVVIELSADPLDTMIWVSNGKAPASEGTFVGFGFESFFSEHAIRVMGYPVQSRRSRAEAGEESPGFEGYGDYKNAYVAYTLEHDAPSALKHLETAADKDDSDYYRLGSAWLSLKVGAYDKALSLFADLIQSRQLDAHHVNIARLYLALTYDLLNLRAQAREHFNTLLSTKNLDPFLKKAALHWRENRFAPKDAANISPDLKYFEVFGYGV